MNFVASARGTAKEERKSRTKDTAAASIIQKWYRFQMNQLKGENSKYIEEYIRTISNQYQIILLANRTTSSSPSTVELDFMRRLNQSATYRICSRFLTLEKPHNCLTTNGAELVLYHQYGDKVKNWISSILNMGFPPESDLATVLRSGQILILLVSKLYARLSCNLLDKPHSHGIHKIIFVLELCKSLHLKRSLLFSLEDILMGNGFRPMRAIIAMERHARNSGYDGLALEVRLNIPSNPIPSAASSSIDSRQSEVEDRRERCIRIDDFCADEDLYLTNLHNVANFLSCWMKDRRQTPSNFSLSSPKVIQSDTESKASFKLRLENEREEMRKLQYALNDMIEIHTILVQSIRKEFVIDPSNPSIGDALTVFTTNIQRPYAAYAVIALSKADQGPAIEQTDLVNTIVSQYLETLLSSGDIESSQPSRADWRAFLSRPIARLAKYQFILLKVLGSAKIDKPENKESRKIKVAGIKLKSLADVILSS